MVASTSVMTILQSTERILVKLIRRLEQRMVGPLLQNMLESVRELKVIGSYVCQNPPLPYIGV